MVHTQPACDFISLRRYISLVFPAGCVLYCRHVNQTWCLCCSPMIHLFGRGWGGCPSSFYSGGLRICWSFPVLLTSLPECCIDFYVYPLCGIMLISLPGYCRDWIVSLAHYVGLIWLFTRGLGSHSWFWYSWMEVTQCVCSREWISESNGSLFCRFSFHVAGTRVARQACSSASARAVAPVSNLRACLLSPHAALYGFLVAQRYILS